MQYPHWHPTNTYIWSKKEIKQWVDVFGTSAFYNGVLFTINTKKIIDDRYEVTFKRK